jgi:hypothetical protein
MKIHQWLGASLACLTAASALAQDLRPASARFVNEPLAKDAVLDPPDAASAKQEAINVRGLPAFAGEVVTHLKRGQTVTVLEQFTLAKPKAGEPADWSRIALPSGAPVYVFADFIDTNTMTVSARTRVNVRGGPGENFSVLARLEHGTPVKEIRRTQGWLQIETPTNAYGFVATEYLALQAPMAPPPAVVPPPEPVAAQPVIAPPTVQVVTNPPVEVTNNPPPVAAAPEPVAPPPMEPAAATPAAVPVTNLPPVAEGAPAPAPADTNAPPRIVTREGRLRVTSSIQAPTYYELRDVDTGELTEFLQPNGQNLKAYNGARVTVTGAEVVDRRWRSTPVLQVQSIFDMP